MGAHCCQGKPPGVAIEGIGPVQDGHVTSMGGFPHDAAVRITIESAKGLVRADWKDDDGPKQPYCVCEVPGKPSSKVKTPPAKCSTRDPEWTFQATMASYKFPDTLLFTVFDSDFSNYEEHLGKAQLNANRLEAARGNFSGVLPLCGAEGISSVPTLNVRVEAVPRPAEKKSPGKRKELQEVTPGRRLRLGIRKKKGQSLGLLLFKNEEGEVIVAEIGEEGAVAEYNSSVKLAQQLQVGDRILEANGMSGEQKIVTELSKSDDLELLVETRCTVFKVILMRGADQRLGMELKFTDSGNPLIVGAISPGVVDDYNQKAPSEKEIKMDDHLLEVNGCSAPDERMRELQSSSGTVELIVRRVFGLPSDPRASDPRDTAKLDGGDKAN